MTDLCTFIVLTLDKFTSIPIINIMFYINGRVRVDKDFDLIFTFHGHSLAQAKSQRVIWKLNIKIKVQRSIVESRSHL